MVVTRVVTIEEHPAVARVVRVFVCLYSCVGNTELRRGRDADECWCNVRTFPILFDAVGERLNPGEVDNGVVVVDGNGR